MFIPDKYKQFLDLEALVIVAAKERGIIYRISNGTIEEVKTVERSEPSRSDDEGFFFKAAAGNTVIGGAPKEAQDDVYKHKLDTVISDELDALMAAESPSLLYVFEPEHYKGLIVEKLKHFPELAIHTVRCGNFVGEHPEQLIAYIDEYINEHTATTNPDADYKHDLQRYS